VYEDIEGRSATDVWVVGHEPASPVRDGVVLRWDGRRWRTVRTEPRAELRCVLLTGSSEVWVGTDDGRILRYDGSTWTTSFSNPSFITIWDLTEDASGRIWAATEGGGILYLDP
jgi:ligand-binding sensor domain-containing protein